MRCFFNGPQCILIFLNVFCCLSIIFSLIRMCVNLKTKDKSMRWIIYSTIQTKIRNVCLSVIFCRNSVCCCLWSLAHLQPIPAYVEACNQACNWGGTRGGPLKHKFGPHFKLNILYNYYRQTLFFSSLTQYMEWYNMFRNYLSKFALLNKVFFLPILKKSEKLLKILFLHIVNTSGSNKKS